MDNHYKLDQILLPTKDKALSLNSKLKVANQHARPLALVQPAFEALLRRVHAIVVEVVAVVGFFNLSEINLVGAF